MKILLFLGHPAHFHFFKNIIKQLRSNKHEIEIVIKEKDILEELLQNEGWDYLNILSKANSKRKDNRLSILYYSGIDLLKKDWKLNHLVRSNRADMMIGTEASIAHVGKWCGIPSIITNEDDTNINRGFCYPSYPFVDYIVSPTPCKIGIWKNKKISYDGYQKLSYLHPKYFEPDVEIVKEFNPDLNRYFIFRFVSLTASHDAWVGKNGFDQKVISKIIELIEPYGNIYFTSERKLDNHLEKYRLKINPNNIHHALYYADLFISNSQSMTVESAMLGTPSIRFNNFVGKISVLEELENKYQLTFGIKTSETEKLYQKIIELLNFPNLKQVWQQRRQKMLSEKIDVTAFMVWLIENYPNSAEVMKKNPNYQYNFK